MDQHKPNEKLTELAVSDSRTLSIRSSSLVRRSLAGLSGADLATVIDAAKRLVDHREQGPWPLLFDVIEEEMTSLFHAERWALLLREPAEDELSFKIATSSESDPREYAWMQVPDRLRSIRIRAGNGIAGWVSEKNETVIVGNAQSDSRFRADVDGWPDVDVQSIVAVPLTRRSAGEEQCLGVLELINCGGSEGYPPTELAMLRMFADFAAIAIGNDRYMTALLSLTITDELTGLKTERFLMEALSAESKRAARANCVFSVVALNVDLESVSLFLGPQRRNQLLREIGDKIGTICRRSDVLSHLGWGEFFLLFPETSREEARLMAQELHKSIKELDQLIKAVVGVATYPHDGTSPQELIQRAYEALEL